MFSGLNPALMGLGRLRLEAEALGGSPAATPFGPSQFLASPPGRERLQRTRLRDQHRQLVAAERLFLEQPLRALGE